MRSAAPTVLLAFEAGIAQALRPRLARSDPTLAQHDLDYRSEVLAAAAMSVVRSALIRDARRAADDDGEHRHLQQLVTEGFSVLITLSAG